MPLPKKPWKPREPNPRVIDGHPVEWKRIWRRRYLMACLRCGNGIVKMNDGATGRYIFIEWKSYQPGDIWFVKRRHRRHVCEKELILKATVMDYGNDYLHPFAEREMRREEYLKQKQQEKEEREDLDV